MEEIEALHAQRNEANEKLQAVLATVADHQKQHESKREGAQQLGHQNPPLRRNLAAGKRDRSG